MSFHDVAASEELWEGEMLPGALGERKYLLLRLGGEVRAYEDRCAHLGVPLSEGKLSAGVLTCRAHEWTYEAGTGRGINPLAACLRSFPVREAEGRILLCLEGREHESEGAE